MDVSLYVCVCVCVCVHACMYLCVCVWMYVCMYVMYVRMCVCVRVCHGATVCVCMYVCNYVFTYDVCIYISIYECIVSVYAFEHNLTVIFHTKHTYIPTHIHTCIPYDTYILLGTHSLHTLFATHTGTRITQSRTRWYPQAGAHAPSHDHADGNQVVSNQMATA